MPDADLTPAEQDEADRSAGWDLRFGHAPGEHGLPVEPLDVSTTPPPVQPATADRSLAGAGIDTDAQMAWAEGEIGFREGADNANPYSVWHGIRNVAYCDSFAQQAACEAGGFRWPDSCQFGWKGQAYCPFTERDARTLGLWRDAGDYRRPARGDQILFDWSGWGGADHIGTVWGTDDDYATVWTVEANTGSPGGVRWVRRDWAYIRGFVAFASLAVEAPAGPRELRKGLTGDDVWWLQMRLVDLGYDVPGGVDGEFGTGTEQAVFNFQHDWSPPVDGVVGLVTREHLADDAHRADLHNPPPPPPPAPVWPGRYYRRKDRAEGVAIFQRRLVERGWTLVPDGYFGRVTDRVVRAFQADKGLLSDGLVGPTTWNAFWTAPVT